jgi:LysR family transcriptional activator of dmlA
VDSGRLKIVLPQYRLPSADLFVVYLNRRNQAARTRAFIDFLVEHFRNESGSSI